MEVENQEGQGPLWAVASLIVVTMNDANVNTIISCRKVQTIRCVLLN
jgi:hypothetical protein